MSLVLIAGLAACAARVRFSAAGVPLAAGFSAAGAALGDCAKARQVPANPMARIAAAIIRMQVRAMCRSKGPRRLDRSSQDAGFSVGTRADYGRPISSGTASLKSHHRLGHVLHVARRGETVRHEFEARGGSRRAARSARERSTTWADLTGTLAG